jgi:hypothetical protein
MNEEIFNSVFWISLSSMVLASFGLCIKYMLKSKCDKVECCCIKIHRDIKAEEEIEIKLGNAPTPKNGNDLV